MGADLFASTSAEDFKRRKSRSRAKTSDNEAARRLAATKQAVDAETTMQIAAAQRDALQKVQAALTNSDRARKLLRRTPDDVDRIAHLYAIHLRTHQVSSAGSGDAEKRRKWANEILTKARDAIEKRGTIWDEPVEQWPMDTWTCVQRVLHEFSMHIHRLPDEGTKTRDTNTLLKAYTDILAIYAPMSPPPVAEITDYLERLFTQRWKELHVDGKAVEKDQLDRNEIVKIAEKIAVPGSQDFHPDAMSVLKRDAKRRGNQSLAANLGKNLPVIPRRDVRRAKSGESKP